MFCEEVWNYFRPLCECGKPLDYVEECVCICHCPINKYGEILNKPYIKKPLSKHIKWLECSFCRKMYEIEHVWYLDELLPIRGNKINISLILSDNTKY